MPHRRLRALAAICYRAAAVPTCGAGEADRILMALGATLEREAAAYEMASADSLSPPQDESSSAPDGVASYSQH